MLDDFNYHLPMMIRFGIICKDLIEDKKNIFESLLKLFVEMIRFIFPKSNFIV